MGARSVACSSLGPWWSAVVDTTVGIAAPVVAELTRLVAEAAGDPGIADRTWVLLTEAPNGGWGLHGHAHTNSELVAAARAEIAALSAAPDA